MAKRFYIIRCAKRGDKEELSIEDSFEHYHYAEAECDALNDRNEADWLHYFVSQYKPEDMPNE